VLIGTQCWMASNLNVGVMLSGAISPTDNGLIEKYCYDDLTANCDVYGGLYSWDEMMSYGNNEEAKGICPDGWHVPSDSEVIILEMALGMDSTTAHLANTWRGSDVGAQMLNGGSSGLNILYAGSRSGSGTFMVIQSYAYLYTSSEAGINAWRRCLRTNDARVGRFNTFPKDYAFSLRCVKDTNNVTPGMPEHTNQQQISFFYADHTLVLFSKSLHPIHSGIRIFDMTGRNVFSTNATFDADNTKHSIQIPHFLSGIYIVVIQYQNRIETGKIIMY